MSDLGSPQVEGVPAALTQSPVLRAIALGVAVLSGITIVLGIFLHEVWWSVWLGYGSMAVTVIGTAWLLFRINNKQAWHFRRAALVVAALGYAGQCYNILPLYLS